MVRTLFGWGQVTGVMIGRQGLSTSPPSETTLLICALLARPVAFAAHASNLRLAVSIIGIATAAHQGFSANLYTLPGDVFPRSAVGSVFGFTGMIGAIGGMVMAPTRAS